MAKKGYIVVVSDEESGLNALKAKKEKYHEGTKERYYA